MVYIGSVYSVSISCLYPTLLLHTEFLRFAQVVCAPFPLLPQRPINQISFICSQTMGLIQYWWLVGSYLVLSPRKIRPFSAPDVLLLLGVRGFGVVRDVDRFSRRTLPDTYRSVRTASGQQTPWCLMRYKQRPITTLEIVWSGRVRRHLFRLSGLPESSNCEGYIGFSLIVYLPFFIW